MESLKDPAGLSLMIVEDDRAAIEILGFLLGKKFPQFNIVLAYDGEMGLEMFKESPSDIVVTDINMPKMDGIDMAREIKQINDGVKIIVMTAYNDRIHLDQFRDIGISHHILKPVPFNELFTAVEKVMKEIQLERQ